MKFGENLLHNEESVLRSLNTRIDALKILGRVANFRRRKMVANGIFMSKLIYLITLWGGSAKYMIVALQKFQNRTARVVTKLDWHTPTPMAECASTGHIPFCSSSLQSNSEQVTKVSLFHVLS